MTGWLDGKRALIVGAGSGIGRAVVDAFLSEDARITVLERDPAKCDRLREELPGVQVVEGDAITRDANERAVTVAVDSYGGLDTLVNCVGVFDFYQGVEDLGADDLSSRVRRDVPDQRAQPSAVGQSRDPRLRIAQWPLDRVDRVHVVVLSRTRRRAVCVLEVCGARAGDGAGP